MIRLSAEAAGSARVRSANWIGFLSAGPTRLAPPAITTVNTATIASRTMLQFSSRTFMPGKRGKWGLVPAVFSPAESASGEAESERHHVVSQKRKPRLGGAGFSWGSGMGDRCASKISRGSRGKVQKQKPQLGHERGFEPGGRFTSPAQDFRSMCRCAKATNTLLHKH